MEFLKTIITYASSKKIIKSDRLGLMDGNKWLGKVTDMKTSDSGDRWEASLFIGGGNQLTQFRSDRQRLISWEHRSLPCSTAHRHQQLGQRKRQSKQSKECRGELEF